MFARLALDAGDRDRIGESWNDVASPSLRFIRSSTKKSTLEIHKKSSFQPKKEIFAESCSVRYKDLFQAKNILGL